MPESVESDVQAAAGGDSAAWGRLVDRFAGLIWAVARAHRLSAADAADVSQTTWLRLAEHLGRLREPDRVGAWLATTARRECLRVLERRNRLVPVDCDFDLLTDQRLPEAEGRLLDEERNTALWHAFRSLSDPCQSLLRVLLADPAPSYAEVSASLRMPIGSIGPTRARCLERLRSRVGLDDSRPSDERREGQVVA